MLGLSSFGIFHTVISLVALVAGFVALFLHKEISPRTRSGLIYVLMTVLSCLTGFGIFRHGNFGPAHILGVLTLGTFGLAWGAGRFWFGRISPYAETLAYSLTFFFNFIPAFTETLTRLPVGAPVASSPEAPILQKIIGLCFVLFLVGAIAQVIRLRRSRLLMH
jgi:hypothetical protein